MKALRILPVLFVPLLSLADIPISADGTYGEKIDQVQKAVSFDDAKTKIKKDRLENVVIEGEVVKVCKMKGCWMKVTNGKEAIRITFKDYGFFVPMALVGKKVRAQGDFIRKKESVSEARHYLEDEGAPKEKIKAVKEARYVYQFVAKGIKQI